MKQRIFMYLFVFSLLLTLFMYVNSKRVMHIENEKLDKTTQLLETYKDSVSTLQNTIVDLSHFNFESNEDAMSYIEDKGFKIAEFIPFIKDELYKLNEAKGEHPMVPYASSEGKRMMINTVKILNHKWILVDFTDGVYWGELFLTYDITNAQEVQFQLVESFLYPFN